MKITEAQVKNVLELWNNRNQNNMSQADIARETHISPAIVNRIVTGKRPVRARTYTSGQLVEVGTGICVAQSTINVQQRIEAEMEGVTKKLAQITLLKRTFVDDDLVLEGLILLSQQELDRRKRLAHALQVIEQKVPKNTLVSYHNQRRGEHVYIVASWYDTSRQSKKISLGALGFELYG